VLRDGVYSLLDAAELEDLKEERRDARRRNSAAARRRREADLVRRVKGFIRSHPAGVTRSDVIRSLDVSPGDATRFLDDAVRALGGRCEPGRGNHPSRWFPPAPDAGEEGSP